VIVTPPYGLLTTTNLTGHPQVVVPCGFVDGMPRGLSFIGSLYDAGSPLRVGLACEQATRAHPSPRSRPFRRPLRQAPGRIDGPGPIAAGQGRTSQEVTRLSASWRFRGAMQFWLRTRS
jgi:hypothetical protein